MTSIAKAVLKEVKKWRKNDYPGVTSTTKRLLEYWFKEQHFFDDGKEFSFWECQREAIESLIYLFEVENCSDMTDVVELVGTFDTIPEGNEWTKFCFNMATGSGKTYVMALAIVWQYYNNIKEDKENYTSNFLIISPNRIVNDRLLDAFMDLKIYSENPFFIPPEFKNEFDLQPVERDEIVPKHSDGVIHITNWQPFVHAGKEEAGEAINAVQALLGKKPRSGEEFEVRKDIFDMVTRYEDLMIINDEAHHAHPGTFWSKMIENINNEYEDKTDDSLKLQLDFSATSWNPENESLYGHIIYSYNLNRAIKDGIVKKPKIGSIDTDLDLDQDIDYMAKYRTQIDEGLKIHNEYKKEHEEVGKKPVLFIMCDSVKHAERVGEYLKVDKDYGDKVLVIHTYQRKTKEHEVGDIKQDELPKMRKAAKNIDKNKYEIIVSVLMLKEGWDVRNVCTIIPLRPCDSDLLAYQTLGRGLRLMYPEAEDYKETLTVIEHPSFIDLWKKEEIPEIEIEDKKTTYEPTKTISVGTSSIEYDIKLPIVKGGLSRETPDLSLIKLSDFPKNVFELGDLSSPKFIIKDLENENQYEDHDVEITLSKNRGILLSQIVNHIIDSSYCSKMQFDSLTPLVKNYIENYFFNEKHDLGDRETIKALNIIVVWKRIIGIFKAEINSITRTTEFNKNIKSYNLSETNKTKTSNDTYPARKCVFDQLPYDSGLEHNFMKFLDGRDEVEKFTKIFRKIPLRIQYYNNKRELHYYVPDFVVITNSKNYLIETKAKKWEDDDVEHKKKAGKRWCKNVTSQTEEDWEYIYVLETDFKKYKSLNFSDFIKKISS